MAAALSRTVTPTLIHRPADGPLSVDPDIGGSAPHLAEEEAPGGPLSRHPEQADRQDHGRADHADDQPGPASELEEEDQDQPGQRDDRQDDRRDVDDDRPDR